MNKKWVYFIGISVLLCVIGVFCINENRKSNKSLETQRNMEKVFICVDTLRFERISKTEIALFWSDENDMLVDTYIVKRRAVTEGIVTSDWQVINRIKSDGITDGKERSITDTLEEAVPQQFEYCVDVELSITEAVEQIPEEFADGREWKNHAEKETIITFEPVEGTSILASNVKICIDPGHFYKPGEVTEVDEYAYVEGDFMLEVALELKEHLRTQYGMDACLTRDSDVIELDGYRNEELDSAHISLRGEYAAKEECDLFVSLHTNSNAEDANGCATFFQSKAINKPIIIINTYGLEVAYAMKAANAIGTKLASVNYELGLSKLDVFKEVTRENIGEWTQDYNDGLGEVGTVVIRTGKKNPDYYGVLRGATNVEVPGIIIEHGYHSVVEVREDSVRGDLKEVWANADACGIAYGFGFTQ